jgi:hypothetical protein
MNTTSNNYSINLKSRVINKYNKNILSISKISVYNWIKLYKSGNLTTKIKMYNRMSKNNKLKNLYHKFILFTY